MNQKPLDKENIGETVQQVSFRDKVLGKHAPPLREKVDLIAAKLVHVEHINGNRLMPMLRVDKKMKEELSIPWKDARVVKLLGKNLGFNIMKAKLDKFWNLIEGFEIMDLGHVFYMVKFDSEDDRSKVINGGPWMIFDHYLTIRLWTPEFNASHATIDKTLVWIRVPSMNFIWYDESFLLVLASTIGNPVKVDLHTLRVAHGRFARICVEVDLNQPVVGKVSVMISGSM